MREVLEVLEKAEESLEEIDASLQEVPLDLAERVAQLKMAVDERKITILEGIIRIWLAIEGAALIEVAREENGSSTWVDIFENGEGMHIQIREKRWNHLSANPVSDWVSVERFVKARWFNRYISKIIEQLEKALSEFEDDAKQTAEHAKTVREFAEQLQL